MEFKKSQSYKCFISTCLWSLLSDLIFILSFFTSYIFSFIYEDWGSVGWIVPLIVKLFFVFCFAVANGYFVFILYMEYKKNKQNIPLAIVNKTEQIFNKIIKSNIIKNIIIFISILSYIFNLFISVVNFYTIIGGLMSFGILLMIHDRNK